jgi:hypothetical protein
MFIYWSIGAHRPSTGGTQATARPYDDPMWPCLIEGATSLECSSFAVDALTAFATLLTVIISVLVAIIARNDAAKAREGKEKADKSAVAVAERASIRINKTNRELERDRRLDRQQLQTEQKAMRQAILVRLDGGWVQGDESRPGGLISTVTNLSPEPISNVSVEWLANGMEAAYDLSMQRPGVVPGLREAHGARSGVNRVISSHGWPNGEPHGSPLPWRMRFTDVYLDEWELHHPSRELILLTPRPISTQTPLPDEDSATNVR